MPLVHADPDEMAALALRIENVQAQCREDLGRMLDGLNGPLADAWQDTHYNTFSMELAAQLHLLRDALNALELLAHAIDRRRQPLLAYLAVLSHLSAEFATSPSSPGNSSAATKVVTPSESKQTHPINDTAPLGQDYGQRRFSIRENEERGGHILEKHVGMSQPELEQRLQQEPHLDIVSSFRDEATAERAISAALEQNKEEIERWLRRSSPEKLPLKHTSQSSLGITLERGENAVRASREATIILKTDSWEGYFVLTAYLD